MAVIKTRRVLYFMCLYERAYPLPSEIDYENPTAESLFPAIPLSGLLYFSFKTNLSSKMPRVPFI